jgi:hypothetical protein
MRPVSLSFALPLLARNEDTARQAGVEMPGHSGLLPVRWVLVILPLNPEAPVRTLLLLFELQAGSAKFTCPRASG